MIESLNGGTLNDDKKIYSPTFILSFFLYNFFYRNIWFSFGRSGGKVKRSTMVTEKNSANFYWNWCMLFCWIGLKQVLLLLCLCLILEFLSKNIWTNLRNFFYVFRPFSLPPPTLSSLRGSNVKHKSYFSSIFCIKFRSRKYIPFS